MLTRCTYGKLRKILMLNITLTAIKVGPTTEDVPVSLVIGPIIVVLVIGISILVIFIVLKRRRYIIFFVLFFSLKISRF